MAESLLMSASIGIKGSQQLVQEVRVQSVSYQGMWVLNDVSNNNPQDFGKGSSLCAHLGASIPLGVAVASGRRSGESLDSLL